MAKTRTAEYVGDYQSTNGPLALATGAATTSIQRRDPKALTALGKTRRRSELCVTVEIAGVRTLVFPRGLPTTWVGTGERSGVFVRVQDHAKDIGNVLALDPREIPEDAWISGVAKFQLSGGARERVLIDAMAGCPAPAVPLPSLDVALLPGAYVVDRATRGKGRSSVELLRVHPPDAARTKAKKVAPPAKTPDGPALELEATTRKLARGLRVIQTDGGPVLALPSTLLPRWHGVNDGAGKYAYEKAPTDYARACDVSGHSPIDIAGAQGLVIDGRAVAFVALPDTSFFLVWIGADAISHLLQAVLSAPGNSWKRLKSVFTMSGSELALIDSAKDGRVVKPLAVALGKLMPGRYSIDVMKEWQGDVSDAGRRHEVIAQAVRLRSIGQRK